MKRIYLFSGGGFVVATSATDFVTKMHHSSLFDRYEDDARFMDAVARRCALQTGAFIDTTDATTFLMSLMTHDFVVVINPN